MALPGFTGFRIGGRPFLASRRRLHRSGTSLTFLFFFFLVQLWPSHSIALLLLLLFCFCFVFFNSRLFSYFIALAIRAASIDCRRFIVTGPSFICFVFCLQWIEYHLHSLMRLPVGRVGVCFDSISVALLCVCVCVCYFYTTDFFFQFWFVGRKLTGSLTGFVFFCFSGVLRWPVESAVDGHPETRKNSTKDQIKNGKSIDDSMAFLMFLLSYGVFTVFLWTPLKCSTPKVKQPNYSRLNSVKLGKTR